MSKMTRAEILEMFGTRAAAMIAKAPVIDGEFKAENIPQHANKKELVKIVRELVASDKIGSVLDLGCGLGRWVRFWTELIGVKRYTGIEPVPGLAQEAERRYEPDANVEIIQGLFEEVDRKMHHARRWDLGFTFTVLEHVPPGEVGAVAEILRKRCKRLLLIEMVEATRSAGFCDYVFQHDYVKIFGAPRFSKKLDPNKALFIF